MIDKFDKKLHSIFKSNEFKIPEQFTNMIDETLSTLPNKEIPVGNKAFIDKLSQHQNNYSTANNSSRKSKSNWFKLKLTATSCSILLITGVVFAKDIETFVKKQFSDFNVGNGVSTAIENGYVGKDNSELSEQIAQIIENNKVTGNIKVKSKVEEFLMTDSNLNISFYFEFENSINDYANLGKSINGYVDYEGSHIIELTDMVILDENNKVLYYDYYKNADFKQFCEEHGVDYNNEQNQFSYSSSVKEFINNDNNIGANFVYNISSPIVYPKSKELNIYFSKINLIPDSHSSEESKQIALQGNWEIHLDIPEIMYTRENSSYKVISCDNENFEVYTTKLTDTNFEIGININNIEEPTYPIELQNREKELSNMYSDDEIYNRKKLCNKRKIC